MNDQTKHYQQLTHGRRYQIQALLDKGFSKAEVARDIGVHRSTISREISRNSVANYCPEQAETLSTQRRLTARKATKANDQHFKCLKKKLSLGWSPENISLIMKIEQPENAISHTTIYRLIETDKTRGGMLHKLPPRFGKTRWKEAANAKRAAQ